MICIESVVEQRFPGLTERQPLLGKTLLQFLRFVCHEREFQQFEKQYPHLEGFDFVEQVLDYFDFSFRVKDSERIRIPTRGRVIIVANHPIGSLDGLALLKMVGEIRPDVKAVANEVLHTIEPLSSLLLPVDNMSGKSGKEQLKAIRQHLDGEGAMIIFPAGEVSRFGPTGIRDGRWNTGFLRFSANTGAPVLPIFVDGRNSLFFYALSLLSKPVSTLWLVREMFKQARNHVDISVGHQIYPEQIQRLKISPAAVARLFRKQVYRLPKKHKRNWQFACEYEAIAHPENRQLLNREIKQCDLLGHTSDGKGIYLYRYRTNSVVMREIGRLRELTFRHVKEGTGKRRDTDPYDRYYDHLVLWDEWELEIVGAYRMVRSQKALIEGSCEPRLYTQTLFEYAPEFSRYFLQGLELGRSFVQPQYWGKRSLDYLWQGIGAYVKRYPNIRYLFGPVSISHEYPDEAKDLLIRFYLKYYGCENRGGETWLASARTPYGTSIYPEPLDYASPMAAAGRERQRREEFCALKRALAAKGLSVPTLYKQYTELCEEGGARFLAFNLDREFADCVDGLIVLDLQKLKEKNRRRYLPAA